MMDRHDPDLSLFGDWPESCACTTEIAAPERKAVPVHKGGNADELRLLLNEMTAELKEQFMLFRDLRECAQKLVEHDAADDVAQKQLRADAKGAADAVSLIVRTLEKIDSLQRQLAHDRDEAAERESESRSLGDARTFFLARIEALALEKARVLAQGRG